MKSKITKILLIVLTVSLMMSLFAVVSNAAAFDKLSAEGASVTLDGTNPTTVTVAIVGTAAEQIFSLEGVWDITEQEGTNKLKLTEIGSDLISFVGMNYTDVTTGKLLYQDFNYVGVTSNVGVKLLTATYEVPADTPAGKYTVRFRSDVMTGSDYNPDQTITYYTATIEVKAAAAPEPEKYTMTINFNGGTYDGEGELVYSSEFTHGFEAPASLFFYAAEKTNHTLIGYSYDQAGTQMIAEDASLTFDKEYTIYAQWCSHPTTKAVSNGDGATHKLVCTNEACNGYVVAPSVKCSGGTATCKDKATCTEFSQSYGELGGNHAYGELIPAQEMIHSESTLQARVDAHYQCSVCMKYFDENKVETTYAALVEMPVHAHAYYYYNAEKHQSRCICGKNMMDDMESHVDKNADEKCDVCTYPMHTCAANKLKHVPAATANCSKDGNIEYWECSCGKYYSDANATTEITDKTTVDTTAPNDHKYGDLATGWYQIGSDWYYGEYRVCDNNAAHVDHTPVTGIKRVPYPTKPIEGFTYAPNADDVAYAESKGNTFIDKDEAWFIFGEDGKFQSSVNGKIEGPYATCYAVNGMIPWHYGLAKINNKYYYFVGDTVNGGNKVANGPVWITRANGVEGLDNGACYYFDSGVLVNNLTDIVDGKYYENGKLMMGAGLVKLENGKYIYVRSNGQLATGTYYTPDGSKYEFDANGYSYGAKNGIYDGVYYENGHVAYGKGLVEYKDGYIYVRSNGQLATGTYYAPDGTKYEFDENGYCACVKNGVVDGMYYDNGHVAYGAGLIKIGEDCYYVRSNGMVATGEYYIANANDMEGFTEGKMYVFGADGKLTVN